MRTQHLRDTRLSLKAIGLFSIILSLPPEWDFSVAGLAAITKDGIATVRAALNELEANGYLTRKRVRGEDGKLENNEYTFYEIPHVGKPAQENLRRKLLRRICLHKKSLCMEIARNIV